MTAEKVKSNHFESSLISTELVQEKKEVSLFEGLLQGVG
jgi:hypothetical protein